MYFQEVKILTIFPIIAAFDFDGTISYRDTLLPFLVYTEGPLTSTYKLAQEIPSMLGFVLKLKSRQKTKEAILKRFFNGISLEKIKNLGKEFARGPLKNKIRPEALKRIKWHLEQGHRCILISASMDVYLKPWAESIGFHDVLSSQFKIDEKGNVSGELLGENCWGEEKVRRLEHLTGPRNNYVLYAYGDSLGDKQLLKFADYSWNISDLGWGKL
jgi:phosphatidylglycerophosphatase C